MLCRREKSEKEHQAERAESEAKRKTERGLFGDHRATGALYTLRGTYAERWGLLVLGDQRDWAGSAIGRRTSWGRPEMLVRSVSQSIAVKVCVYVITQISVPASILNTDIMSVDCFRDDLQRKFRSGARLIKS